MAMGAGAGVGVWAAIGGRCGLTIILGFDGMNGGWEQKHESSVAWSRKGGHPSVAQLGRSSCIIRTRRVHLRASSDRSERGIACCLRQQITSLRSSRTTILGARDQHDIKDRSLLAHNSIAA